MPSQYEFNWLSCCLGALRFYCFIHSATGCAKRGALPHRPWGDLGPRIVARNLKKGDSKPLLCCTWCLVRAYGINVCVQVRSLKCHNKNTKRSFLTVQMRKMNFWIVMEEWPLEDFERWKELRQTYWK